MKNRIILLTVAACLVLFAGCGAKVPTETAEGNSTLAAGTSTDTKMAETADDGEMVDLTILSSTIVYAEMYNITQEPQSYVGKTIKVRGNYYPSFYESTQQYYHNVVVADTSACCAQGLEFQCGDYSYPADFPAEGAEIEIQGVYQSYEEAGTTYYHIVTEGITVVS